MDNLLLENLEAHLLVEPDCGRRRLKVDGQTGAFAQVQAPLDDEGTGLTTLVLGVDGDDMGVWNRKRGRCG